MSKIDFLVVYNFRLFYFDVDVSHNMKKALI